MTVKRNTFDGGTNTTVITEGNSGGLSGDALQYVNNSPTFSNAQAHSGTLSCATQVSTFTAIGFELSATTCWVRFYAYLTQHAAASLLRLWDTVNASGSFRGGLNTKVNGQLDLLCAGTTVDVSGAALTLNQWIRIEAMFSTTLGASVALYNSADSGTPSATSSTATNMGGSCVTQELTRSLAVVQYFDDFAVSDEGAIGPAVDPAPRPPLVMPTAVHRASRW